MSSEDQDYKLPQVSPQDGVSGDAAESSIQTSQGPGVPASSIPVSGSTVSPQASTQQTQAGAASYDSSLSAEDLDLIEKAWVEKAKAIVNDTQGDPHAQNELMSKMKADYMKKRYNRDIKVSE